MGKKNSLFTRRRIGKMGGDALKASPSSTLRRAEMIHLTVWYILQPPTDRATDRPVDCRSLFWVKDDDVAVKSIEGSLLVKLIIMSWTHETPISFGSVLQIDTLGLNRTGLH
jgi:hypothetical protein